MMRYVAALLIVLAGCAPARHRAYTCQAIRVQARAVERSIADMRAAGARVATALAEAEIEIPSEAASALESIDVDGKRAEKRCENIAARIAILEMDLGVPGDVPPVDLDTDAGRQRDKQMTVEHAGIAVSRSQRRVWWNEMPLKVGEGVVEFAGGLVGAMGTVVVEQVADRVPWWIRWAFWGGIGILAIWLLITAWIWMRKRWYELGCEGMVRVAYENNVPKDELRKATEGGAAQHIYRRLRKRGNLSNGSGQRDSSRVPTEDASSD